MTAGTRVGLQTAGDCKVSQCDGLGNAVLANDDTDVASDSQECTNDVCTNGVPSHPPLAAATACGAGGMLKCDGQGACVTCAAPADCGVSTECQARTCVAGTCGVNNVVRGTAVTAQTAGDCKKSQCDGNGATELLNDDTDVQADATSCTNDVCTGGVLSHPPVAAGATCSEGTGTKCDGAGACVACAAAADCPGTDGECQQRTCTAGVCGFTFTAQNTVVTSQTARDCQKNVCNGAGAVTTANDDTDAPNDNNACTIDSCLAGAPHFVNATMGAACGTAGQCSAGVCVGCLSANDCPGTDDECQARSCTNNVCGTTFTSAGTAVAAQTANNCRKNVCDGSGNIVNQNDNADLPLDDGNECTAQACSSGAPAFPPVAVNTACTQNNGAFCSAAGACVACTAAAQCPGSDSECQTRTCISNVCGTSNTAAGFVTTSQTANDCKENQCDGAGAVVTVNKNADIPADDGNQCTSQACNAGVPVFPAVPVNTACGPGLGSFCNATAACVTCNVGTQCPGTDTDCQARTCNSNTCGFSFTSAGTPTSAQTPNDCQENQCNGSGSVVSVAKNTDVPADDGNQCTQQTCVAGAPSFPPAAVNTACNQNGGSFCSAAGACVSCNAPSQCPGTDSECQTRTCNSNVCGVANAVAGTVTAAQVAGDCKENRCDGAGAIIAANQDGDVPGDDGNQCTAQVCAGGAPSFPSVPVDTACNQNGGVVCNSTANCVACNTATQCPGVDTECKTRTCNSGACGTNNTAAGTPTSAQTLGDCKVNQCDGAGNIVAVNASADAPADDGNQCTNEVCTSGVPSHPAKPMDSACNQNGGSFCTATGSCVGCNVATQCPGTDTECQTRTCSGNTCGANNTAAGTVVAAQTAGDCKQAQCDGAGAIASVNDNADAPADDGNQCTSEVCTAGVPSHPALASGTACNQMGGTVCDGSGACVVTPAVASTTPADGSTPSASPSISVTFTTAMNPATLTAQTTAGACSGSLQVSLDSFASCIAFSAASPMMSGGNTVATLTASPGLLVNRSYKIRVTTAASSGGGVPLAGQFTHPSGFTTTSPNLCAGSVVISQLFGGGGSGASVPNADFIELHNRGTAAVTMVGWSLQYASAAGTSWQVATFSGTIQPNGFFLVRMQAAQGTGATLPTPDASGSNINMSQTAGKIALLSNSTSLGSASCPTGASVVDFLGFGTQAVGTGCWEGPASTVSTSPAPSASTAVFRVQSGCADVNNNASDFTTGAPAPRNSTSAAIACACTVQNESNAALEANYCDVQFPLSLAAMAGASTAIVYGQLFHAGTTEAAGANANVRAQLGYGLATSNPQYQSGWTWTNATYNVQSGNNDEYQASFTAPAVGAANRYVYRFSLDQGVSWTYCDANQTDSGAGSNANLTFEFADIPVLTITP